MSCFQLYLNSKVLRNHYVMLFEKLDDRFVWQLKRMNQNWKIKEYCTLYRRRWKFLLITLLMDSFELRSWLKKRGTKKCRKVKITQNLLYLKFHNYYQCGSMSRYFKVVIRQTKFGGRCSKTVWRIVIVNACTFTWLPFRASYFFLNIILRKDMMSHPSSFHWIFLLSLIFK